MRVKKTIAVFVAAWAVAAAAACSPTATPASNAAAAEDLMARGRESYRRGAVGEAAALWERADRAYAAAGQDGGRIDALANAAAAYQSLGQQHAARRSIEQARKLTGAADDPARRAALLNSLGLVETSAGRPEEARSAFDAGLAAACEAGDDRLRAVLLNGLGNLLSSQGRHEEASATYREAASVGAADPEAAAHALVNAARAEAAAGGAADDDAAAAAGRRTAAVRLADDALAAVDRLADGRAKATLLLSAGRVLRPVKADAPAERDRLTRRAHDAFGRAGRIAAVAGDRRTKSYALGYAAELYEDEGRGADALALNRRAAALAQQAGAPHALYRWQWNIGRLLDAAKETERAVAAYGAAVETLASVRNDLILGGGNRSDGGSFRESVGPLFYEQADLLLRRADVAADPAEAQALLLRARDTIETLKSAEVEDYFQDPCVNVLKARSQTVEQILAGSEPKTAVVYLIPLKDRIEFLVSTAGGLKRATRSEVPSKDLAAEVRAFRRALADASTNLYLTHAWQLYEWLIRPIEPLLAERPIDTLVFVPDGPLRTIPMAALKDKASNRFLAERYAVAVTPGLTLVDPSPTAREGVRSLRCGLSRGSPPLPHVPEELRNVGRAYPGTELLDATFTKERLRQELADNAFPIVHIASHARFRGNKGDSVLMTADDRVTLDELEGMLLPGRFRERPVALLVLSACQTAVGDDRAVLGLAGVAIRGGARSAVASLWSVNDEATATVFSEFYAALKRDPLVSKAKAVQESQLKLVGGERRFRHPHYWAPYLVIGNWR